MPKFMTYQRPPKLDKSTRQGKPGVPFGKPGKQAPRPAPEATNPVLNIEVPGLKPPRRH